MYRRDHAPERRARMADGRRTVERGVPTNFFVFYEIDEDKSKHSLSLDEYGQEEQLNACTESLSVACVLSRVVSQVVPRSCSRLRFLTQNQGSPQNPSLRFLMLGVFNASHRL